MYADAVATLKPLRSLSRGRYVVVLGWSFSSRRTRFATINVFPS